MLSEGDGGREGVEGGGKKGDEEDEDRGNGPLPGARVLRLRDITESSRSAESGCDGRGDEGGGRVGDTEEEKGSTFVHVRLKFSVGFQ